MIRQVMIQLALLQKRPKPAASVPNGLFDLEELSDSDIWINFRFEKNHILELLVMLEIPSIVKLDNGMEIPGLECLCLLLRRLSYPNRLNDLVPMFKRDYSILSRIIKQITRFIIGKWYYLISFPSHLINEEYILNCKDLFQFNHAIFGFIDGTVRFMCRPGVHQKLWYNGHKRQHGLKLQSVILLNGIIIDLFGPIEGKYHDMTLLRESNIITKIERLNTTFNNRREEYINLLIFGDPAYSVGTTILSPFSGVGLTSAMKNYNTYMSRHRIAVEWGFGKIVNDWSFLDYKRNLKLLLQPVGDYYKLGCLLSNFRSCFYGNQTSSTFGVRCPTINEYFNK